MIDPAFWQSENVARLPIAVRYFFIGLFSNADDQGRMKAHPALIRSKLYPYDDIALDEIMGWLDLLADGDFVILYKADDKEYLQILNWWKYQHPQWAWPSEHPSPEGWLDRVCYRKGNTPIKENWDQDDTTPEDESGDSGPTVGPELDQSGATVVPAPSISISGSISSRDSGSEEEAATAAPTPTTPPIEPESEQPKPKRQARTKDPPPPAVQRYRSVTNLYPEKALWPGIAQVVGEDEDDLDRWEQTVKSWLACGWNKRNVKTQLEYFRDRRIPGDDMKGATNAKGRQHRGPPTAQDIREGLRKDIAAGLVQS